MTNPIIQHDYIAYGLNIRSEIILEHLVVKGFEHPDVVIRVGKVPNQIDRVKKTGECWVANDAEFLLSIPDVAKFHVCNGTDITIEPAKSAAMTAIHAFLLGSGFAAILHQRNQVVLHASAVQVDGKVIAFAGYSGAGKSTTAAHFIQKGAKLIADDLSVLEHGSQISVLSAIPQNKLSGESLEKLGMSSKGLKQIDVDRNKYLVPTKDGFDVGSYPLDAIFVARLRPVSHPTVRRISSKSAIKILQNRTFRRRYICDGQLPKLFQSWSKIAQNVPMFEIVRPIEGQSLDAVAKLIELQINEINLVKQGC